MIGIKILHDHLVFHDKGSARCTVNAHAPQKQMRVECFGAFLDICSENKNVFLALRSLTEDETWVHLYEPKSKQDKKA